MTQQITSAGSEGNGQWLPIIEYSVKSGVSLSTIRRKIKSNTIPFKLERGKYLILFQEEAAPVTPVAAPNLARQVEEAISQPVPPVIKETRAALRAPVSTPKSRIDHLVGGDEGDSTVRMLSEAYEHALHEKDARIRLLEKRVREQEERLSELRLLVQVIEEKYNVRY
jgi:hypothetical protein